ncbi:MAG: AMP-binding protein, partial [Pseudomonadota bacterium]
MRENESVETALARALDAEKSAPFDLSADSVVRMRVYDLPDDAQVLSITIHHIAADGWSTDLFGAELLHAYECEVAGTAYSLTALPLQYGDYAVWQDSDDHKDTLAEQRTYWEEQLAGVPAAHSLPTSIGESERDGATGGGACFFELSRETAQGLHALARREKTTLFCVMHAALCVLVSRYSGAEDCVVSTPVNVRNRAQLAPLIGMFLNTVPLRVRLSSEDSFTSLLGRTKDVNLEAMSRQDVPFEQMSRWVPDADPARRSPLAQLVINMNPPDADELEMAGLVLQRLSTSHTTAISDLALNFYESGETVHYAFEFDRGVFDADMVQSMGRSLQLILEQVARDSDVGIRDVALLGDSDREALLATGSSFTSQAPPTGGVAALFDACVAAQPEETAVRCGAHRASYREVSDVAGHVGRLLTEHGVVKGDVVALELERTPLMLAAVMAVLRAGAVMLPIEPDSPRARRDFVLDDANARCLLTSQAVRRPSDKGSPKSVALEPFSTYVSRGAPPAIRRESPGGDDLAYIIYTSGSTGKPKGVAVQHGALRTRFDFFQTLLGVSRGDQVAAIASYAFDISLLEYLFPLCAGACVRLIEKDTVHDLGRLAHELQDCRFIHMVPSLARLWLGEVGQSGASTRPHRLKQFATGGDKVPPQLLRDLASALPETEILQFYGPTEATLICACQRHADTCPDVIGQPLDDTSLHVVDEQQR